MPTSITQDAFNTVCNHLAIQGGPSHRGLQGALHGTGGRRDPIGLFIPYDQYSPTLEGEATETWIDKFRLLKGLQESFLESLVLVHDRSIVELNGVRDMDHVATIRERLAEVAEKYGLDSSRIEKITKWSLWE